MKKQLFLIVMLLSAAASAFAVEVEIDGLWYEVVAKIKMAKVIRYKNRVYYNGNIVIPETVVYGGVTYSVTSIENEAFWSCSGLTSVTIPNSLTSIGDNAFEYCAGLKKVIVNDITAWCEISFSNGFSNPLCYAHHLYSDENTEITELIIPNSVTSIGNNAFYKCSGLTSVTIPNSVMSIGDNAFYECSGLSSVTIPNSVTSIGDYAFYGCPVTSITIGNSVTSIGFGAFYRCANLTSVTIPNSVTSIGNHAFYECSGLTSVTIPNSVTSIGEGAFANCSGLTSVTIPNSLTSISDYTFNNCSGLTSVTIPNSVMSIGNGAFGGCSGLTSVTISNNVTSIGDYAFSRCSGLTSVILPNSVTSIRSYAFSRCYRLTSVTIPNSVTNIGDCAFQNCSGLTSVTIPNSVMSSIGDCAFQNCSGLTSVVIGGGVIKIGSQAFASCAELTDVTCYAENVPSTQSNAFMGSYIEYATLHVPTASIDAYKSGMPWSGFKTFMGLDSTLPEVKKCATPTISYSNGKLTFDSETEGAICQYSITDTDITTGRDNEVQLTVTYNISVYATKSGYEDSDVATATLCWIDQQPAAEGLAEGIANVPAKAVLIQSNGGQLTIEGANDGERITVYSINGTQAGSAISNDGSAVINTNLQPGNVAIVRIGQKSVKMTVK